MILQVGFRLIRYMVVQIHWVCGRMKREQILLPLWSCMEKISIWFNKTRFIAAICCSCILTDVVLLNTSFLCKAFCLECICMFVCSDSIMNAMTVDLGIWVVIHFDPICVKVISECLWSQLTGHKKFTRGKNLNYVCTLWDKTTKAQTAEQHLNLKL